MSTARTSVSHPIRVDWLPTPWLGKVGLTFAPGKKQPLALTGAWDRDLESDVARLRADFGAMHLVSLLEDGEFTELSIAALPRVTEQQGIAFHRFPIADAHTPSDSAGVAELVARIAAWAASGENVVIHCKGGLGRAGTVGGCVLRHAGREGAAALQDLKDARGDNCPETAVQRQFIRDFRPGPPSRESRVKGTVLAAAIGDALGHPTEFISSYESMYRRFPPAGVKGYELWWKRDGQRFAPYTDDTQMAEIVLRSLLKHGARASAFDAVMEGMALGFAEWTVNPQGGHRAPGNACMAGAAKLARGVHWRESGGSEAGGCGSVMRAYPFGLLFSHDLEMAEHWAVEHSKMTHGHPIALAACAAMAVGVGEELRGAPPDSVLAAMVEAAARHDSGTARMAEQALDDAASGKEPEIVLVRLQGWAAHEAIAAAMYVVARHGRDVRAALLEGANAPGDSDSIATLAGALLGARLGLEALPADWVRDIERRHELLDLSREALALVESASA